MQNFSSKTIPIRKNTRGDITLLLSKVGDPRSLQEVVRLAYTELHRIAVWCCRKEPPYRSLLPTELANEMCVILLKSKENFKNRRYFYRAASIAMQRLLVNAARKRASKKRGGDWKRVDFSYAEKLGFDEPQDLLDFDAALKELEAADPRLSEIAHLRVYGGLSTIDAAKTIGIAESTARLRWANARKYLKEYLTKTKVL